MSAAIAIGAVVGLALGIVVSVTSSVAAWTSSCASATAVGERTLEITFLESGAEACSFTFG